MEAFQKHMKDLEAGFSGWNSGESVYGTWFQGERQRAPIATSYGRMLARSNDMREVWKWWSDKNGMSANIKACVAMGIARYLVDRR